MGRSFPRGLGIPSMSNTYYRRYRMEISLNRADLPAPHVPAGYHWIPWDCDLCDRHAVVKYTSFRHEIDSRVFPCLGDPIGCQRLMSEIARQRLFLPRATWLLQHWAEDETREDVGTIQGVGHTLELGAIQNVGVVPRHRSLGLGRALVLKALHGFRAAGLSRVYLEVTVDNHPAVQLYHSLGFRLTKTMYRAATPVEASAG